MTESTKLGNSNKLLGELLSVIKRYIEEGIATENIVSAGVVLSAMVFSKAQLNKQGYMQACDLAWDRVAPKACTPEDSDDQTKESVELADALVGAMSASKLPINLILNILGNTFIQTWQQVGGSEELFREYCTNGWKTCKKPNG